MTISEKPFFTRRHIVGSAGVGLTASVAPALAQGTKSMKDQGLQNPADKYPKPPYKKQSQPWQWPVAVRNTILLPEIRLRTNFPTSSEAMMSSLH